MRILIVTPAPPRSRKGNRVTALNWSRILRGLGHQVNVVQSFGRQRCDLMIALHARHSYPSIERFRRLRPQLPLVLALTGTDLYGDIHADAQARHALDLADRLIVLQPRGTEELPHHVRHRTRVIYQSISAPPGRFRPRRDAFEVCVVGHLRPVKDPFRTAEAARLLPETSRLQVLHIGGALSADMERRAVSEAATNPRYRWLGELSRGQTVRAIARCRLLVLTSEMEGGANVVCEALVCGVPVVSSHIAGSVGLLGEDYPGYFPFGNTGALAALLHRCETDGGFYNSLREDCIARASVLDPADERRRWASLLHELCGGSAPDARPDANSSPHSPLTSFHH